MKRMVLIAIFICLLAPSVIYAWNFPDDFAFVGLEKWSQELKKNVFAVQIEGDLTNKKEDDDYIIIGSGFLITKNNLVVGITCSHVISKYIEIKEGKINYKKQLYVGLDTSEGYKRFHVDVAYIDADMDFALLLPKKEKAEDKITLSNLVLNESYLGKNDLIIEGKGILIIGYPLGLGIEYNKNFPVVKFGIISQYTKQNYFLIDGVANPGNSGSPVYSLKDGKIIGMVTAFKPDLIPLFNKEGNLVATLPYNSGLSNALPVEIIKDALDKLGKKEQ